MDGSLLQRLKFVVQSTLPVSNDALFVLFGLGCYLATCLAMRRRLTWAWALVPGMVLSLALEGWEILDHFGMPGLARASAADLTTTLLRHSRDVLVINLAPIVVLVVALILERAARR